MDKNIIAFQEYDQSVRQFELDFKFVTFWVRVYDLPIKGMRSSVAEKVRDMMGGFIKANTDDKVKV